MKRDSSSPDAYLADLDDDQREMVDAIREAIYAVAPDTEEEIEYGMLGYPPLANLAGQKHYVALYVAPDVLARHKANFPGVDAGKSCLRFRRLEQIDGGALKPLLLDVAAYHRDKARRAAE